MPRKMLFRTSEFPYHVTARANNRERFHLPLSEVWNVLTYYLLERSLLDSILESDLGEVMRNYMQSITRTLNFKSGRSGRVFGARYHWTLVNSTNYFGHVLKYVYRNPAKGGLVERVEDYRYSSLRGTLGFQSLEIPLHYPFGLDGFYQLPHETSNEFLGWLNRPFKTEHDQAIAKALKKTIFQAPPTDWQRSMSDLDLYPLL